MGVSKVTLNGVTLMDVTDKTVDTDNLLAGNSALRNDGESITGAVVTASPSDASPAMDGTASAGVATTYSRGDHVHPSDTNKANINNPSFTGIPTAPTASKGTDTTQIATTAFVQSAITDINYPVTSVNSKTGAVILTASDVNALPDTTVIPTATSDLTNDSGFITSSDIPVTSVNTKTGNVVLTAADVNAQPQINISGILKGNGTGTITAATAGTDYQAPLPSQTGNTGKFLTTNGSALSWQTVDALPSQSGNTGKFLTTNGSSASWAEVDVPTKTSELTNDSNFVSDANYVHTDNNFTGTLKTKLEGIAEGAEVNQNAFSNVKVGTSTIAADTKTDTLTLTAGSNITLTPDITNDAVTIAATVPTKVSDLTNDSNFITAAGAPVQSVNSKTGTVTLTASDVGALPDSTTIPQGTVTSVRVQATSPVQSSTNTAQSTTLNTTISLADSYGDTKNPYAAKAKNTVLAGPSTGTATAPSFRTLEADDIPSLTVSKISDFPSTMTPSSHSHGYVSNDGKVLSQSAIGNGDRLVITDSSDSDKIATSYITFGTSTTTFLTNKGTWKTPDYPVTSVNTKTGAVSLTASDVGALPDTTEIPAATSELTNDSGFITSSDIPVTSVNSKTGAVVLTAADVGALPDTTVIPTATSDLTNDSGFITSSDIPVISVNNKTGAVSLTASDIGALPSSTDLSVYMQKGVDYVTAGQKSGTTLGTKATAEGSSNTASGAYSHAEGSLATASATGAHAEGSSTTASGIDSHAEGINSTASGDASHAENNATASGMYSHAEGSGTASGQTSHAEGVYTIANHRAQHVFGEWNIADSSNSDAANRGNFVEIVGNGTANNARSNIRTLDWSGNEILAGKITVGVGPTANMDVATKKYVDDAAAAAGAIISVNGKTGLVVLDAEDVGALPDTTVIPSKTGDLTNDSGFITSSDIPTNLSDFTNDTGFITNSALSDYMQKGVDYVTAGKLSTSTLGERATAEGYLTRATGLYSHAEGNGGSAIANYAHAEGSSTTASGMASHAEGQGTDAGGQASHAEGLNTVASCRSQHVFGEWNIQNIGTESQRGDYVEIVGNGTINARSNARTLDWSGNEVLAGKLTVGAGPTNNMDVATKQYVDSKEVPSELFWVNITDGQESGSIVADKTVNDIIAAKGSGKLPVINYSGEQYNLNYYEANNNYAQVYFSKNSGAYSEEIHGEFSDNEDYWGIEYKELASINSPTFFGTPTAPTPTSISVATQIATKGYVDTAVAGASGAVDSVNGQTGTVVLDADDVGALPDSTDVTKWNDVALNKSSATAEAAQYVPVLLNLQATTANLIPATSTPTGYNIAKYDGYRCLYSTTPSANDNSTKVATTAYVDNAVSSVDALPDQTGQSGKFLTTNGTTASWADSNVFIVNYNGSSTDQTFVNTYTAFQDGKIVSIYYGSKYYILRSATSTQLTFKSVGTDVIEGLTWTSDGTITASSNSYGPEIYWITVTQSDSTYTSDKTFTEIKAAHDDGKLCLMIDPSGGVDRIFRLHYVSSSELSFTRSGKTANGPFIQDMTIGTDNSWTLTTQYAQNRITASGLLKGDGSGGVTGIATGTSTTTYLRNDGEWATPPNSTYNFSGTTFYSGNNNTAEHNANNIVKNGTYYYTSNGPATSLGATSTDGALYAQSYSDSWVGQIAQDYRNGALYVRGKNNGTWAAWQKVYDSAHKPTATDVGAAASSHNHAAGDINSGTLGVARGGTGLTASPSILINLSSSSASNVMQANPRPGVTGTLPVANGGTGTTSFTANSVIMSGSSTTAALTTRAVTNNTSATALAANTNIPTQNTVYYGLNHRLNRTTAVNAADTGYTTIMARGMGLRNADTNPSLNGAINWTYE